MSTQQFTAEAPSRLDHWVATQFSVSVATAKKFIEAKNVRFNGVIARKGDLVEPGQQITVNGAPEKRQEFVVIPQPELPLIVVYQDEYMVAVEKPPGISTHPLQPNETGTLANALVARFPECAQSSDDPREGGFAHRLDLETSGLLLAAKSKDAFSLLRQSFSAHRLKKTYLAWVQGVLHSACEVSLPIAHDPKNQKKAMVMQPGRLSQKSGALEALTQLEPVLIQDNMTLVRATTIFGRMHQVRVHLAHLGHPLLGDSLYGGASQTLWPRGFFLHAYQLELPHPADHTKLVLQASWPAELTAMNILL
jgi:23S rRNA pseudouridine1911/1915/1917 synthase